MHPRNAIEFQCTEKRKDGKEPIKKISPPQKITITTLPFSTWICGSVHFDSKESSNQASKLLLPIPQSTTFVCSKSFRVFFFPPWAESKWHFVFCRVDFCRWTQAREWENDCFIFQRYLILHTLYFIVTHSAPQLNIYGGIAMAEKRSKTNSKEKMPTALKKRCQRSSLWIFNLFLP